MNINFINTWGLKKWQSDLLYFLMGLIYRKKIQKGDKVKCFGIGYPHWKGEEFICTLVFEDGTILIKDAIRVSEKDFRLESQGGTWILSQRMKVIGDANIILNNNK